MTDSVLNTTNRGIDFLGRNTEVARRLGWSSLNTSGFEVAAAADKAATQAGRFRGVFAQSPFYTKKLDEYDINDTLNPLQRNPVDKTRTVKHNPLWDNPLEEADIRVETDRERAIDQRSLKNPYDMVFARRNSNMREFLVHADDPGDGYIEGDPTMAQHQDKDLAEFAEEDVVAGVDSETWLEQPEVARLALENRGGLADKLQESDTLKKYLEADPAEAVRDRSREKVREALDGKLSNSSEILDDEFLEAHPLAALKLLEDNQTREWVEEDTDNAREFKDQAGVVEDEMRSEMAQKATDRMNSYPFNAYGAEFFQGKDNLAEAVVSDTLTSSGDDSFATWLESRESGLEDSGSPEQPLNMEEVGSQQLASSFWADQAKAAVGTDAGIPDHLFNGNVSLSMMTANDANLAADLTADAGAIATSFPDRGATAPATKAYRAYGFGLGERTFGRFLRVA